MTAGNSGTGAPCTKYYDYVVGKADIHTSTGANTAANARQCRFCSTTLSSEVSYVHLKDYAPPVTPTKLIKNLVVIGSNIEGT
jgi:hypothetical protein